MDAKWASLLPIVAGVCWGAIGIFVRELDAGGLDNATIICTRMLVAAILAAGIMFVTNPGGFRMPARAWVFLILGGVVGSGIMNVCYNIAIINLHIALSSVLIGMFAVFAIFLGRIFFKERITPTKLVCSALAIFGVLLVSGALENVNLVNLSFFGVFMGLMSGLLYSFNGVCTRYLTNMGIDSLPINFYYFVLVAVAFAPFCDWAAVDAYVQASPVSSIAWLIGQAIVCSLLPYVLFTRAISYMDLGRASILELIEPAAAMIFGLVLFGEVPTPLMVLGVIVVIVALAFTYRTPKRA